MTGILILGLISFGLWLQYLAVTTWRGWWRWLALAPFAVVGADALWVAVDVIRDPTARNLWPLELLLVDLACLPVLGLGWAAKLLTRARFRRTIPRTPRRAALPIRRRIPSLDLRLHSSEVKAMTRWIHLALAAALLAGLGGCAGGESSSGTPSASLQFRNPLAGTAWSLVTQTPPPTNIMNAQKPWTPKAPVEIAFDANGRTLTGRSLCHDIAGTMKVKETTIALGISTSQKAGAHRCLGEEIAREQAFLAALQGATRYEKSRNRLDLVALDKTVLTFRSRP